MAPLIESDLCVPRATGELIPMRQINLLQVLNLVVEDILAMGSTTRIDTPAPKKPDGAARSALETLSVVPKPIRVSPQGLIYIAMDQKSSLEGYLELMRTEPSFLAHEVNRWFFSRAELLEDERGIQLPSHTDKYISIAMCEVIHNAVTGTATWDYICRLLQSLIESLSATLQMPLVNANKGQLFVSKENALFTMVDDMKHEVDLGDYDVPIDNLKEPGMAEKALNALDKFIIHTAGARIGEEVTKAQAAKAKTATPTKPTAWFLTPPTTPEVQLQQRKEKQKTRPAHSSGYDIAPPTPVAAITSTLEATSISAAPAKPKFKVRPSTLEVFDTLFQKSSSQGRGSIAWTDFEAAMANLNFSVIPKLAPFTLLSQRGEVRLQKQNAKVEERKKWKRSGDEIKALEPQSPLRITCDPDSAREPQPPPSAAMQQYNAAEAAAMDTTLSSSPPTPRSSGGFFRNYRVYLLTSVAYMGSFLFGYDTGVMGSVLALSSFKSDFGLPLDASGFSNAANAQISSNVVSLLTAGCFFGAIIAAVCNERFGRKYSLMGFSVIFLVGAAVQTAAQHSLSYIYAGRVVAGLGIGGMSSITPVFVAENCPPEVRGRITGLFQEFLVVGVTVAYWLNYGVALHIEPSSRQWRIPVAIQLVPGGFLLIGLFFLKESPRWLMKQGRHEQALSCLAYMRNSDVNDPAVLHEIAEIRASIEEELALTEGITWKECIAKGNRGRFVRGFLIMFWQQFSGTNSIGYYAPQIFQTVGVSKTNASLFATGIYGVVKVCSTGIFLIIGIDKFGRRKSLLLGAAWMAVMMFILGAVLATHPPTDVNTVSPASIAMVVMIYLYVTGYSASWGPIPWVYLSEIFPTRLRAYGVGMGAATQWLFNFCITEITPNAVANIGWRTFIMFGCFCTAMGVWVFVWVKETKGRTLEEMDILFGAVDEERRKRDIEMVLHDKEALGAAQMGSAAEVEDARR